MICVGTASAVPIFVRGGETMRKLMWFSIGFGAACAICVYAGLVNWINILVLLTGLGFAIGGKWCKPLRMAALTAVGAMAALIWFSCYQMLYLQPAMDADGETLFVRGCASDYSYETGYGSAVKAEVELGGQKYNVLMYLNSKSQLVPGDEIEGEFRLRCTLGGNEAATYHRGNGILLLCYPKSDVTIHEPGTVPDRYFPVQLRQRIMIALERAFPEDTAWFAKALLLGEKGDVPYDADTAFKVSGISHIIAVSGLHVSMLCAVIVLIGGKRRGLTALIGIPVLFLFAAVAGFTPSVVRACVMQSLMLLALLFDKEYDPPTALAFAALCMLVVNPLVITSASFQLSVGCMAGIFLFSKRIGAWISSFRVWKDWKGRHLGVKLRTWISGGVGVTLGAMFFTTPLVAYYFGCVSLVGVITNLLTLWVVSFCFNGIMLVSLLSFFWSWGASAVAWMISSLMRYVLLIAKILAAFPLAAVYTTSIYIILWLVVVYVLISCFLLTKKRQPFVLICTCVCTLCVALLLSWMQLRMDNTTMTMLDVGQGQCIILHCQDRTFLIDCGGDNDEESADLAAETLLSQGISRLDGIIVTHYDRDHAGGVGYLLQRVPADAVFLPDSVDEDGILESILPHCNGKEIFVSQDLNVTWSDCALTIFAPILSTSDNERGLCVLFRGGNCDILITGDLSSLGEQLLLRQKEIPELTVLVAGHHGSKSSTCQELLEATTPEYVLISAGEDNFYGHPHDEVLQRLEAMGCKIYRTDQNGTVTFGR